MSFTALLTLVVFPAISLPAPCTAFIASPSVAPTASGVPASIPPVRPCVMFNPYSAKTFEGEDMPNSPLNLSFIPVAISTTVSLTLLYADLMPSISPVMRLAPH